MKYNSDSFLSKFIFHLIGLMANSLCIFTLVKFRYFLEFFLGQDCMCHSLRTNDENILKKKKKKRNKRPPRIFEFKVKMLIISGLWLYDSHSWDIRVYYITINRQYFRQSFQPIAYFVIFYDLGFFPLNICY